MFKNSSNRNQYIHDREAMLTAIQIRLVSEKKLRRIQRRMYRDLQTKIFKLWDEFDASERSAKSLLKACSHLNGPTEKSWRETKKYNFVNILWNEVTISWNEVTVRRNEKEKAAEDNKREL